MTTNAGNDSAGPPTDAMDHVQGSSTFDQTCRMESAGFGKLGDREFADLLRLGSGSVLSKEEKDYVTAAVLLRERHVSERALRRVLRNWTPFGHSTLAETVHQTKLIDDDDLARVEQSVNCYLQSVDLLGSLNEETPSPARRTSRVLEQIDPSGRVAKLFGLSQIPRAVVGHELRTFQTKYRLIRKLGQGGLGTVWLAVDTCLNRYVAVKEIVSYADTSAGEIARFQREAQITGRLEHPGIVPIHVFGQNEADGRCFYVMRFLGNETLEDAIRVFHEREEHGQQSMELRRLLTALVSVCDAIAYAHSRGVIHRDLKPQNIALDRFGQVIVLDWGIAKSIGVEDPQFALNHDDADRELDSLDVTLAGRVTGTAMYMAPEQAAGRVDEIDEKTDVYGLGGLLYAALTGYAPHEMTRSSLAQGTQISAYLAAIIERPCARPRQLNPRIPASLEAICLKAMHRDRNQRYSSATSMSDDLQRWLANEPISAFSESGFRRIRRWMGKHGTISRLVAAATTLILVAGMLTGMNHYQRLAVRNQLEMQSAVNDAQGLRGRLSFAVESLRENTRFMSRVPLIQDIVNARRQRSGTAESIPAERLRQTYQELLAVNPTYVAVTFWLDSPEPKMPPIRVEAPEAQRGVFRIDLEQFFSRHLPAIKALQRGDVYIGIPGRNRLPEGLDAVPNPAPSPRVGRCFISGIGVYDDVTHECVGGVVIECDLDQVFEAHFRNRDRIRMMDVFLTSPEGKSMMRFNPEHGLIPIDSETDTPSLPKSAEGYFRSAMGTNIVFVAEDLAVARILLDKDDPKNVMGLIFHWAGNRSSIGR